MQVFAKHYGDEGLGQEEGEKGKALLPQGQDECSQEVKRDKYQAMRVAPVIFHLGYIPEVLSTSYFRVTVKLPLKTVLLLRGPGRFVLLLLFFVSPFLFWVVRIGYKQQMQWISKL